MSIRRSLYKALKYANDANAVKKGKVARRAGRRVYGKIGGKLARGLFK